VRNTWQCRSSPLREAEPGAMGHVATPEPTSTGRRGSELRNVWRRRSSTQQGDEARGHRPRGSTRAHLSKEVRSGAVGHVVAPEPTSVGRYGPKLQFVWQRVDARTAPCLNLEHVCGVPDLQDADRGPWAHLGRGYEPTCGINFLTPPLGYLIFLLVGRRRAHHQYENVDGGPSGGAGAEGPGVPTTNVKTSTTDPREVTELKIRERSACRARPSGRAVNSCRNLGTNTQRVVRTHFTLPQVGHFY
jgi:hypothetical protein